jgi:hypothetical protein
MTVTSGIVTTAIALQTWFTAQLAAGMTIATVASTLLGIAMRLIPFVAVATAIGFVSTGIVTMGDESKKNTPYVDNYGGAIRKSGDDALWAANAYGIAAQEVDNFNDAITKPSDSESRNRRNALRDQNRRAGLIGGGYRGGANAIPKMPDFSSLVSGAGISGGPGISEALTQLISSQNEAANAEQGILDKRVSAFESFSDSVKSLFGQIKDSILSSFNLPTLGNSVNSITRNIGKLLEKTKGFASDISKLSGLGLNSALLQQVIQAGPMAGSRLASAIVGGGSAFISQLNSAYGEFGNLASGIAGSGVNSAFNNPTVANTYNIEVNGGVGSGPTIGKAIVDAIKSYERTSGAVWQGA